MKYNYNFTDKGGGYNNMKTFGVKHGKDNTMSSMINSKIIEPLSAVAMNGNIMTASTVVTSLDEECTTIAVSQLMLKRYINRNEWKIYN